MKMEMAKRVAQRLGFQSEQEAKKYVNSLMRSILNATDVSSEDTKGTAITKVEEMLAQAAKHAGETNGQIRSIINKCAKEVHLEMEEYSKKRQKQGKEDVKNITRSFLGRLETKLKNEGQNISLDSMKKAIVEAQIANGTTQEVANALANYYLREYINLIVDEENAIAAGKNQYIQTLKGYYLEEARTDAINEAFRKWDAAASKKHSTGKGTVNIAINIGGQNNITDIKLNLDALAGDSFTAKVIGVADVDSVIAEQVQQVFDDSANTFGAQVKSWMPTGDSWVSPVLHVGNRVDLLNGFKASQYPYNSQIASIAYMGLKDNILSALGINNVLYMDGKNNYWTDEFIQRFRQAKYYLTFDYKKSSDGKYLPSGEVILYQYAKSLTHKTS